MLLLVVPLLSGCLAGSHRRDYEALQEASLFRDTLLSQARQNPDAAQASYETGHVELLPVIEAQMAPEYVELDYQRASRNVYIAREELDWAPGSPLHPTPAYRGGK